MVGYPCPTGVDICHGRIRRDPPVIPWLPGIWGKIQVSGTIIASAFSFFRRDTIWRSQKKTARQQHDFCVALHFVFIAAYHRYASCHELRDALNLKIMPLKSKERKQWNGS